MRQRCQHRLSSRLSLKMNRIMLIFGALIGVVEYERSGTGINTMTDTFIKKDHISVGKGRRTGGCVFNLISVLLCLKERRMLIKTRFVA